MSRCKSCGIELDFFRQNLSPEDFAKLVQTAKDKRVIEAFESMCSGDIVNVSEGRPVVTITSGAQSEIIQDGVSGFLIRPDDVDQLKETLERLLQDAPLLRTVGQNARRRIETAFTMDHFYTKLNRLYDSF